MGKYGYLKMRTDREASGQIGSDLKELGAAAKKLVNHAIKLGSLGFGTTFLQWVASFAAIYLLVLDRTNWRTNILTGLLIPYIFFSLPSLLFDIFRGEVGKWIAFIAIILRLFFPRHFPVIYFGSRLAGNASCSDSIDSGGSKLICKHPQKQLDWSVDMSSYCMLSSTRAHPSIWWL